MGKFLICLILVVSSASAMAILSTQASCDAAVVTGTNSASCGNPPSNTTPSASATAGPNFASASAASPFNPGHGSAATAMVTDDLVLTVTAGPTDGFFIACLSAGFGGLTAAATAIFTGPSFAAQQVAVGFGPVRSLSLGTCKNNSVSGPPVSVPLASFTLGVPIRAELFLTAQAGGIPTSAAAIAQFNNSFEYFDASMNPVPNVTYSLVEVPEPAEVFLLISGLVALLILGSPAAGVTGKLVDRLFDRALTLSNAEAFLKVFPASRSFVLFNGHRHMHYVNERINGNVTAISGPSTTLGNCLEDKPVRRPSFGTYALRWNLDGTFRNYVERFLGIEG